VKVTTPWFAGAVVLGASLLVAVACVDEPQARSPWMRWTRLRFKARAVPLFHGQVVMQVTEDSSGRKLETSATARFIGATIARTTTTSRFDSAGITKEYSSFSRKRRRHYVFGERSYTVEKLRKGDNGEWTVRLQKEFPYPEAPDGSVMRMLDYYGMLLQLRNEKLQAPGDEVELHVATSGGPEPYRIRVSEIRSNVRTITDSRTGEKKPVAVRELRLVITPGNPEAEKGFLGMEGETEIWVEAESKTPLEIVGKIPKIPGKVRLILTEMG